MRQITSWVRINNQKHALNNPSMYQASALDSVTKSMESWCYSVKIHAPYTMSNAKPLYLSSYWYCKTLTALIILLCNPSKAFSNDVSPCSEEIQAVVRATLESKLVREKAFPDYNLVKEQNPLMLRELIHSAKCRLTSLALPNLTPGKMALVAEEQLEHLANRSSKNLVFTLSFNLPKIEGDTASLWFGVTPIVSPRFSGGLECCCSREVVLKRTGKNWKYDSSALSLCS